MWKISIIGCLRVAVISILTLVVFTGFFVRWIVLIHLKLFENVIIRIRNGISVYDNSPPNCMVSIVIHIIFAAWYGSTRILVCYSPILRENVPIGATHIAIIHSFLFVAENLAYGKTRTSEPPMYVSSRFCTSIVDVRYHSCIICASRLCFSSCLYLYHKLMILNIQKVMCGR